MRPPRLFHYVCAAAALGLAACGDNIEPSAAPPTLLEPSFTQVPSECSTSELAALSRDYFSNPAQQTAGAILRHMEDQCAAGEVAAAIDDGWSMLTLIESVLEDGTGGTAADGAALAQALMDKMCEIDARLCEAGGVNDDPVAVTEEVFGPHGLFAVRSNAIPGPALARAAVPFDDYSGAPNGGLWGIETSESWSNATGVETILFYGAPSLASDLPIAPAVPIEDLGYALNSFPNVRRFSEGLHVGICYESPIALPHVDDDPMNRSRVGRLQRQGNLLEWWNPAFGPCASETALAGVGGLWRGLAALATQALLPRPLFASLRTDREAAGTGGTPIDFSHFALSAVDPDAFLEWQWEGPQGDPTADDVIFSGTPIGKVTVWAKSSSAEEVPFENVLITLFVAGNSGFPAGATVCSPGDALCEDGSLVAPTREESSGLDPKAEFPTVTVNKAGGYILCARGAYQSDPELAFAQVCTEQFNVKNGH